MVEKNTDASWAAENDCSMSRGVAMLCVCGGGGGGGEGGEHVTMDTSNIWYTYKYTSKSESSLDFVGNCRLTKSILV